MSFSEIVALASKYIMDWPFIILLIGTGLYFSIRTGFLQVRYLKDMVTMLFRGKSSSSGISSFQAFMLAMAGRVGTGNLVGVATAIALGGPGAVFWMWITAFFGASTAYVEASLGQVYKEKIDGHFRGGPAYYILKGLKNKTYALAFAIVTILAMGVLLPGVQSNSISEAFHNAFGTEVNTALQSLVGSSFYDATRAFFHAEMDNVLTGGLVVLILAIIIFGGVKRIARVAEIVTPFMAVGYIIMALIIVALNFRELPAIFTLIIKSAFGFDQALGGVIGAAISMGVRRGLFANEAGQGTAPHAAAAAQVSHPGSQGLVQAFSVYVDTMLVCTATAFIIIVTGMYRVYDSVGNVVFNAGGLSETITTYGAINVQSGVEKHFMGFGQVFVAIALFFFAFTTILNYYFQAETNVYFLAKKKRVSFWAINILRVVMIVVTFIGSINTMKMAWDIADIGLGLMSWFNIVAILLLQKPALKTFFDYERQRKQGIAEPKYKPAEIGIANADEWK
ncbi:MAG: alanine:cation symporter family protein [Tannerella sp.]|jgi:AGCS family alanine or glycine:cation symporter|nr:alanine:cation symporter family protein [Tannerella sp.]